MSNGKLAVGDRVKITNAVHGWWFKNGQEGVVVERNGGHYCPYSVNIDGETRRNPAYVDVKHVTVITPTKRAPSIAKDLRLTPQARTVLKHLEHRGRISPSEALITYSISRLASCIHEVRRAGYNVLCIIKKDEHGHKYARYTLIKPSMVN